MFGLLSSGSAGTSVRTRTRSSTPISAAKPRRNRRVTGGSRVAAPCRPTMGARALDRVWSSASSGRWKCGVGSEHSRSAVQQRALLAVLLLHANVRVPRERLIEELWGDAAPPTVNAVLNNYLTKLRRLLASGDGDGVLTTKAHGYVLHTDTNGLDAARFEQLIDEARAALARGEAEDAAATFREALALWRGPALADFAYEQFAQREIRRLEELRLAALEDRIDADLALRRHETLVAELEALVAEHAYRERMQAQLMLALYRSGRQAEALDAYGRARRTLVDELGIEPAPRLQDLERAILRHDNSLEPPVAPAPVDHELKTTRTAPRARVRWTLAVAIGLASCSRSALRSRLRRMTRRCRQRSRSRSWVIPSPSSIPRPRSLPRSRSEEGRAGSPSETAWSGSETVTTTHCWESTPALEASLGRLDCLLRPAMS